MGVHHFSIYLTDSVLHIVNKLFTTRLLYYQWFASSGRNTNRCRC